MKHFILPCIAVMTAVMPMMAQPSANDEFWETPQGTFDTRRSLFLDHYSQNDATIHPLYRVFRQLALAASDRQLEPEEMEATFDVIKSNRDCNDFTLNGLIRLKTLYPDALTADMHAKAEERILDFKYWWDDVRRDTTYRCYHTENHQGLYHTAELLAGQMYRQRVFADGKTGEEHISHALQHLMPWLDYRFRFGFSEWNSTYYDAESLLLLNLYDFAEQPEVRRKAHNLLNLLMFDMALANYRGFMGGASSRNYAYSLIAGTHNTSAIMKLAFGVGSFARDELMGSTALATSSYRCPDMIVDMATDYATPYVSYQRNSIEPDDAALYGLTYDNERDCRLFWGMQEFIHPKVVEMSKMMSEKYNTWPYGDYDKHIAQYAREVEETGHAVSHDRFALSEGNIITMRTPNYMISTTLDYHKGRQGYQQHIWQATLGHKALVYTNSPGSTNLKYSPNYWAGTERFPRAAQHGCVSMIVYHDAVSHAYFPEEAFDSIVRHDNWMFGCKDDGYVALYTSMPSEYTTDFRGVKCDLKSSSRDNVYVCEMGDKSTYGDFESFIAAISAAKIEAGPLNVSYHSPSQGHMQFGWDGDFVVAGNRVDMRKAVRYDNSYCHAPFDCDSITISRKGETLTLLK